MEKSKELIIEIAENLGLVLSNLEEIKSRYDYNKYVFKYDSLFSVIPLEIIIGTSYFRSVYPTVFDAKLLYQPRGENI